MWKNKYYQTYPKYLRLPLVLLAIITGTSWGQEYPQQPVTPTATSRYSGINAAVRQGSPQKNSIKQHAPTTLSSRQNHITNTAIIKRFYSEIWNAGHKDVAPEILHEKLVFRGSTGPTKRGIPEFLQYVELIRGALQNYRCVIQEIVSTDDRAVAKMTFSGKHTGRFFGVAPSGKTLVWNGAAFFHFSKGKIRELWVLGDVDALKQQLELTKAIAP